MTEPTYPRPACFICAMLGAAQGQRVETAVKLLRVVGQDKKPCGWPQPHGQHGIDHPHPLPRVPCTGFRAQEDF